MKNPPDFTWKQLGYGGLLGLILAIGNTFLWWHLSPGIENNPLLTVFLALLNFCVMQCGIGIIGVISTFERFKWLR